jgi:hypothetical protein
MVGVRNWNMAVLGVAYGVGFRAVAHGVCLEAPFATVAAVVVSVVTGLHADKAVVTDLEITVFILDEVNLVHCRWIGPCARSLCSFDRGNREWGRRSHGARLGWYAEQWECEECGADAQRSPGSCKVFCISIPKCCFGALELLSLYLSSPGPVSETLYLSSQSDFTHLFEHSVNHSPGLVGRLKDLEVVITKHMAVIKGGAWSWLGMEVAAVKWFVVAHGPLDIWVLSDKAVSYLAAYLGCLVFVLVDEEDLGHSGVSTIQVECPSEILHDLFFI